MSSTSERNTVRKPSTILMLLSNSYDPDPRVRQEALALIRMGCRVKILAWDRDRKATAHECVEGVHVERVFLRSTHGRGTTQIFFYAFLYLKMLWRAWRVQFDAVHCHDLDTLPLGFVVGKLKRKRVVYDAHESFPDMVCGHVPWFVTRGLVHLENCLIRRVDLLVTVGEKLRIHFEERGARQTTVVGNWKRPEEFCRTDEQNAEVRRRLEIPAGALTIVCITNLLGDRKLNELIEAANRSSDVYVIIGGRGALEPTVKTWAARNPRIRYVGFVPNEQIPDYTCASDAVYYGFDPENPNARFSAPNKLFEALAAGKPVITGDFGEIASVVRHSGCGLVLRRYSADEIEEAFAALRDPDIRAALVGNSQRYGRAVMNWDKGEETLYRDYSRLLPNSLSWPGARSARLNEFAKSVGV